MKEYSTLYHKLPILKWLFAIAVLFSIGGYSNYTSPKIKEATTELVIIVDENDKKTTSFQNFSEKKYTSNSLWFENMHILQLPQNHTKITLTKPKKDLVFCSSIDIEVI